MIDLFATLIAIIFNIVCGYFIAKYIGAKKRIGHFNSFQWTVSFGAIFGLIISLSITSIVAKSLVNAASS